MKKTYNDISFSNHDTGMGSRIKLLPILLVILLIAAIAAGGYFGYKFINTRRNTVVSIAITQLPKNMAFLVGEDADFSGLEITATRKNGKTFTVDLADCHISGFDSSAAMQGQPIKVSYRGINASFSVDINELPKPTPLLKSISLETLPKKTTYKLGEWLSTDGGVILCEYTDGSKLRVNLTNNEIYGFVAITSPGTYTLTVKYKENGIIAATTYTITVTE